MRTLNDSEWEALGRDGSRLELPRAMRAVDDAQHVVAERATSFGVPESGGEGARWSDMLGAAQQAGGISALTSEVRGATDTYEGAKDHGTASANLAILSADLHYQIDKSGTVEEFPGAP